VRVSTLSSLLQKWVTPRLQRLYDEEPELQVDWHTSRDPVDFGRSDYHAAIRFGPGPYTGLSAEKLMDEWLVVIAAPQVLARYGSLDDREDLKGLPLLHAKDEPWSRWSYWFVCPRDPCDPEQGHRAARVAAIGGAGVRRSRRPPVAEDTEGGRAAP